MIPKKIVITGGPSTGKTSIIYKIEEMGFPCLHEISRSVTLEARRQGIQQLFITDPLLFSKKLLDGRAKQFLEASKIEKECVFLDRGLPDVLAYMRSAGQKIPEEFDQLCKAYRYDKVFLLPPWKEIYTADNERYENYEEAIMIHDHLGHTYKNYGYSTVEVPKGTIKERISFILKNVN